KLKTWACPHRSNLAAALADCCTARNLIKNSARKIPPYIYETMLVQSVQLVQFTKDVVLYGLS
ncbi:TPA: hypothetical protein ACN78W_002631, partial [Klebsiella pneumoniae]